MTESLKQWLARNVTFSLVLAVFTEVPRWVFAFAAINEPLWAGVPLAVLIAFATAHAWQEYFAKHEWLLLSLNLVSLVFAVFTIAPVLYTMIDRTSDGNPVHLSIADVFSPGMQGAWVTVLACTTFLPLIQLAVVESRREKRDPVQAVVTQSSAESVVMDTQALETQAQVEQVSPNDHYLRPSHDVAQPDPSVEATMQVDASDTPLALTELDEMNARIIDSIRNGNYTPYAISKDTGIAQTTLKRKQGDGYGGRLSQLCAMGMIHNSSGADGSEYRLNEGA